MVLSMPSTRSDIPTVDQVSAGGVAFRRHGTQLQVALISVGAAERWQLPKGTVERGETNESAAVREVREETGIQTEVVILVDRIEYWFFSSSAGKRTHHHKFVYFYLLRALSGDIRDHDHEVNESRWVEINAAAKMLKFENERRILKRAQEVIDKRKD
jgi:mutator protein MutT